MPGHSPGGRRVPPLGTEAVVPGAHLPITVTTESRGGAATPGPPAARPETRTHSPAGPRPRPETWYCGGSGPFSQRLGNGQNAGARLQPQGLRGRLRMGSRAEGGRLPGRCGEAPPTIHRAPSGTQASPSSSGKGSGPHRASRGWGRGGLLGAGLRASAPRGPLSPLRSLRPSPLAQSLLLMQVYSEYMAFQKYLFVYI